MTTPPNNNTTAPKSPEIKISGYTTVRNAVEMDYPFEASIRSMVDFCDQVVVVDSSDKEDGTMDILQDLMDEFPDKVEVYHVDVDWTAPNHGIYDGQMKAFAREQCTGDLLWQMDADEVVAPGIRDQVLTAGVLTKMVETEHAGPGAELMAFPVLEYWGGKDKVRVDVNPWKWRLSKNDPNITHGIPKRLRTIKKDGLLYAQHGTDGCDYIYVNSGEPVPCANFMTQEVEFLRQHAVSNPEATKQYEAWLKAVCEQIPPVYHFWFRRRRTKLRYLRNR